MSPLHPVRSTAKNLNPATALPGARKSHPSPCRNRHTARSRSAAESGSENAANRTGITARIGGLLSPRIGNAPRSRSARPQAQAQGRISTGVPTGTSGQISSISGLVTAMHPAVQLTCRWSDPTQAYLDSSPWISTPPPDSPPTCVPVLDHQCSGKRCEGRDGTGSWHSSSRSHTRPPASFCRPL